jgi:hypothetical protein
MNKAKYSGREGTALLMTILILSSIVLISLSVAQIVFLGIKMGEKEAQSTKAYFLAEAGAERILFEFRKGACEGDPSSCDFSEQIADPSNPISSYAAKTKEYTPGVELILISTGQFNDQYRTVEMDFNY